MGGVTLLDVKTYYIVGEIETIWPQWKDRQINGAERRTQKPKDLCECVQLTFGKDTTAILWRKTLLSTDGQCWSYWTSVD